MTHEFVSPRLFVIFCVIAYKNSYFLYLPIRHFCWINTSDNKKLWILFFPRQFVTHWRSMHQDRQTCEWQFHSLVMADVKFTRKITVGVLKQEQAMQSIYWLRKWGWTVQAFYNALVLGTFVKERNASRDMFEVTARQFEKCVAIQTNFLDTFYFL